MLLVPEEAGRNRNRRIDRIFQYDSEFSFTIASTNLIRFPLCPFVSPNFILNNLFYLFILMVILSIELTRVNPDRNIFPINI